MTFDSGLDILEVLNIQRVRKEYLNEVPKIPYTGSLAEETAEELIKDGAG